MSEVLKKLLTQQITKLAPENKLENNKINN